MRQIILLLSGLVTSCTTIDHCSLKDGCVYTDKSTLSAYPACDFSEVPPDSTLTVQTVIDDCKKIKIEYSFK
jgi:hypothetical protein